MITCTECLQSKATKYYQGRNGNIISTACRSCRNTPHAERVARQEIVKASTISKMSGRYDPPAWNVRKGSDEFLSIKSRYA